MTGILSMNQDEMTQADNLNESQKNKLYGFKCLHYSVSEAAGFVQVCIMNKRKLAGKVRVITKNNTARAGEDFEQLDEVIFFKKGDNYNFSYVKIIDDEAWDPDEDFFLQLLD